MPPTATPLVRSAGLAGYRELVRQLGETPERLLREVGIDSQALDDPDRLVSYRAFIDLLELSAERTGCGEFGLRLSQKQGLVTLGPVGLLARQEPDVRHAVGALLRHMHLHAEGLVVRLGEDGGRASVMLDFAIPGLRATRQVTELSVGMGLNMIRLLLGTGWAPDSVYFAHAAAADPAVHRRLLGAPVYFDWEYSGYAFPADLLDRPIRDADDDLHRYLSRYIDGLEAQHGDDVVSKTRRLIQDLVSTGRCAAPLVARYLTMDTRTLQRRLRAHGTSFKALTEEVRANLAARHLRESRKSLTEIAELLGYSELSAFTRSFRRWFGQPPTPWRAAGAPTAGSCSGAPSTSRRRAHGGA